MESEKSDIKLVMDHDANRSEMDKKNAKNLEKFHNRGEIGILPSTGGNPTVKESILDKYLHLESSRQASRLRNSSRLKPNVIIT